MNEYNNALKAGEWLVNKFNLICYTMSMKWETDWCGSSLKYQYFDNTDRKVKQNIICHSSNCYDLAADLNIPKEIISPCGELRLGMAALEITAEGHTIPKVKVVYELVGKGE